MTDPDETLILHSTKFEVTIPDGMSPEAARAQIRAYYEMKCAELGLELLDINMRFAVDDDGDAA